MEQKQMKAKENNDFSFEHVKFEMLWKHPGIAVKEESRYVRLDQEKYLGLEM